jgi:hypothetical protein
MRDKTAPNPSPPCGAATRGPPRSVHSTTIASPSSRNTTFNVPVAEERAPYLVALVGNSCRSRARLVTAEPATSASIHKTSMRGRSGSSNGATIVRTSDETAAYRRRGWLWLHSHLGKLF